MPETPKKILIVDDEKDVCEILKTQFEKAGFSVTLAFDGAEGYEKALTLKPDCILMDVRMPKEDGLTCLRKLRAYRHDDLEEESRIRMIPVVILTGAGAQMKPLFSMEKISGYVEKPYDFEILRAKILESISA